MIIVSLGCSVPKYMMPENNMYDFLIHDYFNDEKNTLNDFGLKGNVKKVTEFVPIKIKDSLRQTALGKSLDREYFFNKKGFLNKEITYYSGTFYFQGQKNTEKRIHYYKNKKQWVETYFVLDSSAVRYSNRYDNRGNLIETENQRNRIRILYDKNNRPIQLEYFRKNEEDPSVPSTRYTYEYKDDNYVLKKRLREKTTLSFVENNPEHFLIKNQNLKKRWFANSQGDTTSYEYNKGNLVRYYMVIRGTPHREKLYKYDNNNLLAEELNYIRANKTHRIVYEYDKQGGLINQNVYGRDSKKNSSTTYAYIYDTQGNWISKTHTIKDQDKNLLFGIKMRRKIEYYQ